MLVAEDGLFRDGVESILSVGRNAEILVATSAPQIALRVIESSQPDLVVLDLESVPSENDRFLRELASVAGTARLLILTWSEEADLHSWVVRQGAVGVVTKQSPSASLLDAVDKLRDGQVWMKRAALAQMLDRMLQRHRRTGGRNRFARLTARESEIAGLVAEGLTNRELADRLELSEATVRHHLTSIFAKLEVRDRVALVIAYLRRPTAPLEG